MRSEIMRAPGVTVGEMALLSGRPRAPTVEAQSGVQALELSRANYERLAVVEPALALRLVEKLAHTLCLLLERQLDARTPRADGPAAKSPR